MTVLTGYINKTKAIITVMMKWRRRWRGNKSLRMLMLLVVIAVKNRGWR